MGSEARSLPSIRSKPIGPNQGISVMGVLNATPDSFYDGGWYTSEKRSQARVDALIDEGADIIDIGGESSRPGAPPVAPAVQIDRVTPALKRAVQKGVRASIDTTSPEVADRAIALGATIVNDVSCLRSEELASVAARHGAALIVTHSREPMQNMRGFSEYPDAAYGDVVQDVREQWLEARARAERAGLDRRQIWFDPGLGFCKNAAQSFELLARLEEFADLHAPVVVGASRKSFIGSLDGSPAERRLGGSIAACLVAVQRGAWVLRVHDVLETRQALALHEASGPRRARHRHV